MKKFLSIIIVFVILLSVGMISYADTVNLQELPENRYSYNVIIQSGDDIKLFSSTVEIHYDGTLLTTSIYPNLCKIYIINNNDYELYYNDSSPRNSHLSQNFDNIIYSNYDIKYANSDDVFFSKPIVPLYLLDNKTLLQPLSQSVTSNIQILLACGVGILSLILLVGLFRKLYLYL